MEATGKAEKTAFFKAYKPGQGKTSRTLILWTGFFLLAWGSRALMLALPEFFPTLGHAFNEFEMFGGALPQDGWSQDLVFFTTKISPAFAIAVALLAVTGLWWWRFTNLPKWADLVIDMEHELRKVSWPTFSDAWQSTLIVTFFTAVLVVLMFVFDIVIRSILQLVAQA